MDPTEMRLLAEQLAHALDRLSARIGALEASLAHQQELTNLRLEALERRQEDQELRLRASGDALVRLTTLSGLAQVSQAVFALLLSALAAWLGSR